MTDIRRLWERDSQSYPEYKGREYNNPAHIQETVLIDITKSDSMPIVTRHIDGTYSLHDTIKWGHIRLTRTQAEIIHTRLGNALRDEDKES